MIPRDAPIFVHTDVGRGLVAAKRAGAAFQAGRVQQSLIDFLAGQVDGGMDALVFPAFNYDYGRSRVFDVDADPVQVGSLVEWLRAKGQMYRSQVPFFSFLSGTDLNLDTSGQINPFGEQSGFHWIVDHNATIALFGASLHSLTFIHYVEEMSGKPLYRYDKDFPGRIVKNGVGRDCQFSMHVRPMDVHLDYDWAKIEADLKAASILQHADYSVDMQWLNARALKEFWGNKIVDDPLYLIDQQSRAHFEDATDGGRRRVTQKDYEDV